MKLQQLQMIVEKKKNRQVPQQLKQNSPNHINSNSSFESLHLHSHFNSKRLPTRKQSPNKMSNKRQKSNTRNNKSRQKGAQVWKHKAVLQMTQKLLSSITGQLDDKVKQLQQGIPIVLNTLQIHRINEIQQLLQDLGQSAKQPDKILTIQLLDQSRKSNEIRSSRQGNVSLEVEKYIEEVKFMHTVVEYQEQEIKEVSAELYALKNSYRQLLLSKQVAQQDKESSQSQDLPSFGVIQPISIFNPQSSHEKIGITQSRKDLKNKYEDEVKVYDQLIGVNKKLRELNRLMEEQIGSNTQRVEALTQQSTILQEYISQINEKIAEKEKESKDKEQVLRALKDEVVLQQQNLQRVQGQLNFLEQQCQLAREQLDSHDLKEQSI